MTASWSASEEAATATGPMRLSILGATGSIGTSTLSLISYAPADAFQVVALTAQTSVEALAAAAVRHGAEIAVIGEPSRFSELKEALAGTGIAVAAGESGLLEAADRETDCVMAAIVGAAGLRPTIAAARRAKRLALANKECLVVAGEVFMREVAAAGCEIMPVDSEHSAVFQALNGEPVAGVERIILTASGGPFRDWPIEQLASVTREQALKHPNWEMGAKITIDSATMMNKGLELIEAYHLFPVRADQLDAIIHPQSIVHCLVEHCDGSVLAQLAMPDMRTPIAHSLAWPSRMAAPTPRLDLARLGDLSFSSVDDQRFPAFALAREALRVGGGAPAVLNGANESAVAAFLEGRIGYLDIAKTVRQTMEAGDRRGWFVPPADIDGALRVDADARQLARDLMDHGT